MLQISRVAFRRSLEADVDELRAGLPLRFRRSLSTPPTRQPGGCLREPRSVVQLRHGCGENACEPMGTDCACQGCAKRS